MQEVVRMPKCLPNKFNMTDLFQPSKLNLPHCRGNPNHAGCLRTDHSPHGLVWFRTFPATDKLVLDHITHEYEALLRILPIEHLHTVLDAGANAGYSTRLFAHLLPGATIIALEPDETNHALLVKNTAQYPSVRALRAALWSSRRGVPYTGLRLSNGTRRFGKEWQYMTSVTSDKPDVVGVSVNALLNGLCLPSFDLVKMDIEGSERSVLDDSRGRLQWLLASRYLYLETHEDMVVGAEVESIDTLLRHNFSVFGTFRRRRPFERVYLACNRHVGVADCRATCVQWRGDANHTLKWCRQVESGLAARQL